jgi:hypothetical protein
MGRLTLNVLLSFAQFEREVTGERIRDKIAASRRKGMWMGGTIPLGYDVKDRKLVINAAEAETVRHIMRRYLELGSVKALMEDLNAAGIRTKQQVLKDGGLRGGLPFVRGPLYHLLKNRIYVGEIPHHDNWYPGEHQAIVEPELFDQVQALLARNAAEHQRGDRAAHSSLLTRLIRNAQARPMSPSHANKGGRRYRYYISNEAVRTDGASGDRAMRLPAVETERAVINAVSATLEQARPVRDRWTLLEGRTADRGERNCRMLATRLRKLKVGEARSLLLQLGLQIVVEEERIIASCSLRRLAIRDAPYGPCPRSAGLGAPELPAVICFYQPDRRVRRPATKLKAGRIDDRRLQGRSPDPQPHRFRSKHRDVRWGRAVLAMPRTLACRSCRARSLCLCPCGFS